jgi:hypothetical protein
MNDRNTTIETIGQKRRRHITISGELDEALDEVLPDHVQFAPWAETVLWKALADEYGEQRVEEAARRAQDQLDSEDVAPEHNRRTVTLDA